MRTKIYEPQQKMNGLTFLEEVEPKIGPSGRKVRVGKFTCHCGKEFTCRISDVLSNKTTSCKCILQASRRKKGEGGKHYMCSSSEYYTYSGVLARCTNPKATGYSNYGGRGIKVCDRWLDSFINFYEDMGSRPDNTTLDRINVNGNYCKENCRWATKQEQARNQRNNIVLTYNNETRNINEWAEYLGISVIALRGRVYRGWDIEKILTTPFQSKFSHKK